VKTARPVIHARDHLPGGADPMLPGLVTGPNFPDSVFAIPDIRGYWRLGDGEAPYLDTSRYNITAPANATRTVAGGSGDYFSMNLDYSPGGLLVADDGAVKFNAPGSTDPPTVRGDFLTVGISPTAGDYQNRFAFPDRHPFTIVAWVQPGASGRTFTGPIFNTIAVNGTVGDNGWRLELQWPSMVVGLTRAGAVPAGGSYTSALSTAPVPAGSWSFVAGTYDGTTSRVYINGVLAGALDDTQTWNSINYGTIPQLATGPLRPAGDGFGYYFGGLDEVVVWARALTADELLGLYQSGSGSTGDGTGGGGTGGGGAPGNVLTLNPDGTTTWQPPTVEVGGGGVNPPPVDETPADSSEPAGTGPTTASGWHLNAHFETVVLHDPNPGRFDVPTMKWVRVPFTSITIYRTWEPTVDAEVLKTARLKDDRGLMQAARDGILHINPDMAWPDAPPMDVWIDDDIVSHPEHHLVEGWFPIEYPVLDAQYLPENDVELGTLGPTPDAPRPGVSVIGQDGYQRASRFMNLSTGSVLRIRAGSTDRAFGNWWFWGTADDSTGAGDGPGTGNADNPFPVWGEWPARPIHMTLPYPQLSPVESRVWYQDYQGMAGLGFGPYRGVTAGANFSAGANLCMQAWQDTPWLLRFSTARFPAYRGFDADYNGFPHLAVSYHYDPDTINHTTGRLLLPAT